MGTSKVNRMPRALVAAMLALLFVAALPAFAGEAESWDLSELYGSEEAWNEELATLKPLAEKIATYKGTLAKNPTQLREALELQSKLGKTAARLYVYAMTNSDLDTKNQKYQGMKGKMGLLFASLGPKTSWINPEVLAIPAKKLAKFRKQDKGLAVFDRYFERLEKGRKHVLSPEVEGVLASTGLLTGDGAQLGTILRTAEMPWPTIKLADGSEKRIDVNGYSIVRASNDRVERVQAYQAFFGTLKDFEQSLALSVANSVKAHVFSQKVRHFDNTLQAALKPDEVDTAVYEMLVQEINAALPTLHRYLKLRARMLNLNDLGYYDLYPTIVADVDMPYPWPKAKEAVLESFAPLGEEYVSRLRKATDNRWIDVYPTDTKRTGAYVVGAAYDVHPYMLLNHQDDYDSASTFAHEAGHLMHSWYSNEALPYETADYETFVAEVASTTNEWLFFKHNLENAKSDDERLAILGNFLESVRQTVFRQTMFAEFELEMHKLAEGGKPLTADALNELYLGLLRKYHGHDKGVCNIDELYGIEWAFIPHFHYDYYVYTYATSFIAGTAFVDQIRSGAEGRDRYIDNLLKAGSSKPPVQILKDAGVDMTTPAPFRATMKAMEDVMDQIEAILDKRS